MYKRILVPVDLADPEYVKPAIKTALMIAEISSGSIRLLNVLPMTPVMLAEYVPPDFDVQQRQAAEEALAIVAKKTAQLPQKQGKKSTDQCGCAPGFDADGAHGQCRKRE